MKYSNLISLLLGFILFSTNAFGQHLKPGFDKYEYMEALKISARSTGEPSYYNTIDKPQNFEMVYQSSVLGLQNQWDLWKHTEKAVAAISIRGTTPNAVSWLENFYAAMVPAKGSLTLADDFEFDYALSENPMAAVHVGWLIGTGFIVRDLLSKIDSAYQRGTKEFLVIGHSQGGGIAYLLTAHLRSLQKSRDLPNDLIIKTYCSAAPKPGNLYFAYTYEDMAYEGWAYNVVNAKDWVPEVPMSIQTTGDFNTVNPFMNAEAMIRKEKFPKRMVMKSVYNQLDKPTKKARRNYKKYLGKMTSKTVEKNIPGFIAPELYDSNHYVRTGNIIVLNPNDAYLEEFADDPKKLFIHHIHTPYLRLASLLPEPKK
jgi:hypothetical protein